MINMSLQAPSLIALLDDASMLLGFVVPAFFSLQTRARPFGGRTERSEHAY